MKFMLDTNTISYYLRGEPAIVRRMHAQPPSDLVLSAITVMELRYGVQRRKSRTLTAAVAAGYTRLRPVLMTAGAMMLGMVPMSLGVGEGGEQNAPLGRAVIGGLLFATFATLIFVPAVYSLLRRRSASTATAVEPVMATGPI